MRENGGKDKRKLASEGIGWQAAIIGIKDANQESGSLQFP